MNLANSALRSDSCCSISSRLRVLATSSAAVVCSCVPTARSLSCSAERVAVRSASSALRRPMVSLDLADLGELVGGLRLHLLDADFEPPGRDRDLGMDLVHVRLDHRHQGRRHGLEVQDRRTAGSHAHGRDDAQGEQGGEQKSDPEIDDRFTHYQTSPVPPVNPTGRCRRLATTNDYTRSQTKMKFVCWLGAEFFCLMRDHSCRLREGRRLREWFVDFRSTSAFDFCGN